MFDRLVAVRKDEGLAYGLAASMMDEGFDVQVKQSRHGGYRLRVPGDQYDRAKQWIESQRETD